MVGPGWEGIVEKALAALRKDNPQVKILQVKEKFGGLRIYVEPNTQATHDIISLAEERANGTCERCGSVEGVETKNWSHSWVKTLCPPCGAADDPVREW